MKIVCNDLNLFDVNFIHGMAEEVVLKYHNSFDVVTVRAVASIPMLLEYCISMVKCNKYFIVLKGDENILDSKKTIDILNSEVIDICKFELLI